MRRTILAFALLLGALAATGLSACGGDDAEPAATAFPDTRETTPATTATATTAPTTPTTTVAPTTTATTTATTTQPSGGATTTQPSGGASAPTETTTRPAGPAGCADAVGGFIRDVRASGTDCGVAGEVAAAWFDAIDGGAAPDAPVTAAGFACSGALAGQVASVTCQGKGGRVTFTASP
jgi:hypothetical protein